MKLTYKGSAEAKLEKEDIVNAFKSFASSDQLFEAIKDINKKNPKEVTRIITQYLESKGMEVNKVQKDSDLTKVVADVIYGEGAKNIVPSAMSTQSANNVQNRRWLGFYETVSSLIDKHRKKKKTFISYKDLYEELIGVENSEGEKMFVKENEPIEFSRFRQYLSNSQMARQTNMAGVEAKKKGGIAGLSF